MNPENNNPLQNPFAAGNPGATSGIGQSPMPDNLASAEDNLTSAGLAAGPSAGGAIGLDQIAASDNPSSALNFADDPLVPAAPVPGSIGSAISMPPADPIAAPAFGPAVASAAPGVPNVSNVPYADPAQNLGAMPAPDAQNLQPASAPYNPFAAPEMQNAQAAPQTSYADPAQNLGAMPAPAPTPDPAHTAPAVQPMPLNARPAKSSHAFNPLVVILAIVSVGLLVLAITFFILWNNEKKNLKPIYYPQVSGGTNSTLKSISCQRAENYQNPPENPSGSGKNIINLSFTGDKLSAYSSNLSLDFANEEEAARVRDTNAPMTAHYMEVAGGSFTAEGIANGNNYTYKIVSRDGVEIAPADAQNIIYGTTEGNPSLALADLQAKYESEGYACTEE